jgi:DNA processing protein
LSTTPRRGAKTTPRPDSSARREADPEAPFEGPPDRRQHRTTSLAPVDALDWLRLQRVFALRPERIAAHLERGATPNEILTIAAAEGDARARAVRAEPGSAELDRTRRRLEAIGAQVVPQPSTAYPPRLAALADAPCVLLVRGCVESLDTPGVAIIGARAATRPARDTARRLARDLAARGVTIVSGLARGIDAEAHRGALEADGRTIAVLACGPEQIYPPEHRDLAREIARRGAVVTEMPVGASPRRAYFPLRNRLISGLSLGVIVVEARRRSGSLITVRHALNQGREVFVVPGAVSGPFAEGTNLLLREGARAVLDANDVMEDLGLAPRVRSRRGPGPADSPGTHSLPEASAIGSGSESATQPPDSVETVILELLADGPLTRDALAVQTGLEAGILARALLELELVDRVVLDRDGRLQRNWS